MQRSKHRRAHRRHRRAAVLLTVLATAAAGVSLVPGQPAAAAEIPVGSGSYSDTRPAGTSGPVDSTDRPVTPQVTERMAGQPVPTNDWWSSLVFKRYPDKPYSQPMYGHPLSYQAVNGGLEIGYPTEPAVVGEGRQYEFAHKADLTLGVAGLDSPDTKADGWSDWTVSPYWSDGSRTLRATIGHGSPYVYAEATGGAAEINAGAAPEVFADEGSVLGVTVGGHHYGLFAPGGSDWTVSGTKISAELADAGYYSVAVLPGPEALEEYRTYAYSFVTGSKVDWDYDAAAGRLNATYTLETEAREGEQTGTLQALYRHQWQHTSDELTGHEYVSPRGTMKVRAGGSFTTSQDVTGVLPALPETGGVDKGQLAAYVNEVADSPDPFNGATDTYWTGKAFGRLAQLVPLAEQAGATGARDKLLAAVKERLEEWLTAGGASEFSYDGDWKTLTGYPASYGSDKELNDHHFHYSYYVMAAAVVARYDPAWAADSAWGGMVKELIADAANPARGDARYPFLRGFDVYAGHSWASGHQGFAAGNNQESSSESVNLSAAMIMWGAATGDTSVRDLGVYLLTTESETIRQYWFDGDQEVFPEGFGHQTLGMVWSNGGAYSTWWTANPEEIHGINVLPVTGGSLHLARDKAAIDRNLAEMERENGGPAQEWREILWEFRALSDPAAAKQAYDADPREYEPEAGESWAHIHHWINTLATTGAPDTSVTADSPTAAVFAKGDTRTYAAHNYGDSEQTVTFSDGHTLTVPPKSSASDTG
ncbi:glycoside hydrolase [Streptomyces armeniacus]|uniref:glucan endo-1,3-beta-D-glucosidase n=1 Tax=Streptomyces armeniacus TaxID=83291 RepID=A0A345Y110_9ACTN|nr:glycosyl hydrolase [Streptomyces armeniacus]AXK37576.1 glycoside hydrolase [Streptomyces armeniacus]